MLELDKLYFGDAIEKMKEIDDHSIDTVIIDPPYFLPANHYQTRTKFSRNFADLGILEHFFKDIFNEFNRIMKPTGTIYVFCDGQSYPLFWYYIYPFCKSVRPLIWDKKTSINGYSWRHQHELIIFAEMPEAKPIPSGDGDILRFNAVKVDERMHPAQKPVELIEALVAKSTKEGDLVLDCFAGSGTTLVACRRLKRRFIGIELSEDYYKNAVKRMEQDKTEREFA